jgi:Ring hydroxylating alpha subunit (catalytic domain)
VSVSRLDVRPRRGASRCAPSRARERLRLGWAFAAPAQARVLGPFVWPGLKLNVYPGPPNLSIGPVWPEGPDTVGFLDYFFGPDVDDATARELIAFDDQVGREDTALVESVQRGVRAGLLERGRFLPDSERLIAGFQRRVTEAIT